MQLARKLTQVVRCITIRNWLCSALLAFAASQRQAIYLRLSLMLWIAVAAPYSALGAVIHTATFNGHTYHLLDTDGTKWWQEAEAEAALLGGHLVTINTAEENQWVFETFAPVTIDYANTHDLPDKECISLWIGLSDAATEGTWMWVSGEPVTYTNWGPGQPDGVPDQNFAGIYVPNFGTPGTWHDLIGDTSFCDLPFGVVEVAPLCMLRLEASATDGTLSLEFTIGTQEPATWNVWLTVQSDIIRLLSTPLPTIDPPSQIPMTIPFFPPLGNIGVLATLTTPDEGILCSDFATVDTGPIPEGETPTLHELQDLFWRSFPQ